MIRVGKGVILGVWVGAGVDVSVAVDVGGAVTIFVGTGEVVNVGGSGVIVTVSVGNMVVASVELHPANVRARTASPIKTGSLPYLKRVIMGAIIPLW